MSLRQRLYLGFGLVLFLMLLTSLVGIYQINKANSTLTKVNNFDSAKQRYAINYRGSVHDRAIAIRDAILVTSASERAPFLKQIQELDDFYQDSKARLNQLLKSLSADKQEDALLQAINMAEISTLAITKEVLELQQSREQAAASVEQAQKASHSLDVIRNSVTSISDMNLLIASAVEEQSSVALEIDHNFSSITNLASQVAQESGLLTSASQQLAELADNLQASVQHFKV